MSSSTLVTGANGHLGNTLVRRLVSQGVQVRAGVRNTRNLKPFKGVACEVMHADLLNPTSLERALSGVSTLYQVGAVFKIWAKDPEQEILQPNLVGTRNILGVAAKQGVEKIVFVSSIAALGTSPSPVDETSWNEDPVLPYYKSKMESEKLALSLADELGLNLVSVLPAGIVGPSFNGRLTPTMGLLNAIITNQQPIDPGFHFHLVHIEDVVKSMVAAEQTGRRGERYILANESPISTTEIFAIARSMFPGIRSPVKLPRRVLVLLAMAMEAMSLLTGRQPDLTRKMIQTYGKPPFQLNTNKARRELGFKPQTPAEAIRSTLVDLSEK